MQNMPFWQPFMASPYLPMLYQPYMPFNPFYSSLDIYPSNFPLSSSFYVQPEAEWPKQPSPSLLATESQTYQLPPPSPAPTP